jgi:S1-C subfamily serine protease
MLALHRSTWCIVLFGLLSIVNSAAADPGIYQHVLRSTVLISNIHEKAYGSGVLIDVDNHLVVTNAHVVGDASEVLVYFAAYDKDGKLITDRTVYETNFMNMRDTGIATVGTVIAQWPEKDLAVVQLAQLPAQPQAMPLASGSCGPGSEVHGVGNSDSSGGLWSYVPGKVRNVYLQKHAKGATHVVETTSPINPGDSGGPIANDNGELVGIVRSSAIKGLLGKDSRGEIVYDNQAQLVSFAIDVREVRTLLEHFPGN